MRAVDIIEKKRDGKSLTVEEIKFMISGYTDGSIPDYQMSAFLMAVFFRGMTKEERAQLTTSMVHSGDVIDLSAIEGVKVDKHSTGGVGDKITLVVGPLVASLGVPVAKMSGRGLGHTGGTIDKLESIPGFHVELSNKDFIHQVNDIKLAVIGQTGNLTPADKKLYALRDVTATVNSIPLIASSIMSKKLAAGADRIVLDVKTGAGAFMKTVEDARELAKTMVEIGQTLGKKTVAYITDMNQPLGFAVGNALEVQEAIETLRGKGPHDVTEIALTIASEMVYLAGMAKNITEARTSLEENMANGKALNAFRQFIEAQGGNGSVVDDFALFPKATYQIPLRATQAGYIEEIVANEIGVAAMMLGAGRATKEANIDMAVGIVLHKKVGESVNQGDILATIYSQEEGIEDVITKINDHIHISPTNVPTQHSLVYERIE
jgi:pyrimidine-nucleoside phosphorylase